MQPGQLLAQRLRGGIGIEPQPSIHGGPGRRQDLGGRRIRVLVRVELDQALDLRLFARDVGVQSPHERADQRLQLRIQLWSLMTGWS